ncbi:MAG: RNA-guided endonuclease InsQ/TnpB family protein, partial [Thermoplasmata archaeon]
CSDGYVRRKWDNKDSNKIEDICHQISRKIVDTAKENNFLIVLGELDEIQKDDKGRKMNRKLHNFPHWKLREYIKYKAKWEGIKVIEVSESYTSQRCSRCGEIGDRHKGRFRCDNCGLEIDADKNGAHNIARRGIGKFEKTSSDTRGVVTTPEATTVDSTSALQVGEVGGNPC